MGILLTISCYIFTFSPSFCIFCRFIAHDPVRIILFFLGSFFWLVSILFSSLIWLLLSQILPKPQSFFLAISTSILIQESSRIAYFLLLKAAQSGLNKITKQGQISVAPGVSDLQNSRHMLGLVCGLGMGVISALFLTMNAFAAFSGPGTIGMPEALLKSTVDVNRAGKYLPAFYSASALLLSCFHVCWTIMIWDSCHRFGRMPTAYLPGFAALITHFAVAYLSTLNTSGFYILVLSIQLLILITSIAYCNVLMGGTIKQFIFSIFAAILPLKSTTVPPVTVAEEQQEELNTVAT